jgi:predicted TPR repeat methyltransferase
MPIGSVDGFHAAMSSVNRSYPKKVLDLGIGLGLSGAGVRQWVDFRAKPPFTAHLTGVEIFEDYRNPLWDLYDVIHIAEILSYVNTTREKFDFILLCDVLEHFEHKQGAELIDGCKRLVMPGGSFVITTPGKFFSQGAVNGNEYETHRSHWSPNLLIDYLGFFALPGCNKQTTAVGWTNVH